MLKVRYSPKNKSKYIWIPVVVSMCLHFIFFSFSEELSAKAAKSYKPMKVDIQRIVKPEKPKEKPELKPKPKPKPKPKSRPDKPKPNKQKPPQKPEKPLEPVKEVFGVTNSSVTNQNSQVSVRVGNTLNKEMEKEVTKVEDIKPLPPAPKRRRPVPIYELSRVPSFKKRVIPKYTDTARRAEVEGVVELEVLIDEEGRVVWVKVRKKLGYGLDEAAVKAIKNSTFVPGLKDKEAVPVKLRIPYRFVLED